MLDKLCLDPSHLGRLLKVKLAEEKQLKLLDWLKLDNFQDVEEWKENLRCLSKLNQDCMFQCETFALAVHILDDFLGFVKVKGKYLKCAAYASYYIAAKLLEEDEFVPDLNSFVQLIGNKFTINDITRMEKIILEKTNWNMNHVTICSFLDIFYSLVCGQYFKTLFGSDNLAYSIYRNLAEQAIQCISYVSLVQFKGSVKALALLSCTLEKITSRWFTYVEEIAQLADLSLQGILECRDVIKTVLFGQQKKLRPPRVRKFMKRQSMLTTRRHLLSPIVENPLLESELVVTNKQGKIQIGNECVNNVDKETLFDEEMSRLRQISLDEMQLPSPAKRRKLTSCSLESKLDHNICGLLTSPIKPMPV